MLTWRWCCILIFGEAARRFILRSLSVPLPSWGWSPSQFCFHHQGPESKGFLGWAFSLTAKLRLKGLVFCAFACMRPASQVRQSASEVGHLAFWKPYGLAVAGRQQQAQKSPALRGFLTCMQPLPAHAQAGSQLKKLPTHLHWPWGQLAPLWPSGPVLQSLAPFSPRRVACRWDGVQARLWAWGAGLRPAWWAR